MIPVHSLKRIWLAFVIAALLLGLDPAAATAQTAVKGSGTTDLNTTTAADGAVVFSHIAVNAWLDADGAAHGWITWEGDVYWPLPDGRPSSSWAGPIASADASTRSKLGGAP